MNAPSIFRQRRVARWFLPVGVLAILGLAVGSLFGSDEPTDQLAARSGDQLVADLRAAAATTVSGTVIVHLSTGSSDLPKLAATPDSTAFAALLGGSHAVRYWYGGAERQRVALLGATDETDVFRTGREVWQWHSGDRVAVHSALLADVSTPMPVSDQMPQQLATLMPQPLVAGVLAAIDKDTAVSVADSRQVAGRPAYQLVLTPRDPATRVASVRIAVDAEMLAPLAVEVYARGKNKPVIDVAYSSVSFKQLPSWLFAFTPPPGSKVIHAERGTASNPIAVEGAGWASIVEYRLESGRGSGGADRLVRSLARVRGEWGTGGLLDATLLCVLVTDEGRVFAGAVDPAVLYAAAERRCGYCR